MICLLSNLIDAACALVLILAGLIYIVNPKQGRELLRRLVIFLGISLVGMCLLRQFWVHIGLLSMVVLGIAVMVLAFLIFEARRGPAQRRPMPRRGADRTPILPQHHEENGNE